MNDAEAFEAIVAHYESIVFYSKLVTVSAIINLICWGLLIYSALMLRRAAKNLKDAAIAMETRRAETTGSVAKP